MENATEIVTIIPRAQIKSIGLKNNNSDGIEADTIIVIKTDTGCYTNTKSFTPDKNGNLIGEFQKISD